MTDPNTAPQPKIPEAPEGSFGNPSDEEVNAILRRAATRRALGEAGIDPSETVGNVVQHADATNIRRSEGQQGVIPHPEEPEPRLTPPESS